MVLVLRDAEASDEPFLWAMLEHAAHVKVSEGIAVAAGRDPRLAAYVESWGADAHDIGVVALRDGVPIGAAWARRWSEDCRGYLRVPRFDLPEVAMAVEEAERGQGVGRRLLERLQQRAPAGLILSVREDNPARGLYERVGFVDQRDLALINRAGGSSRVMVWLRLDGSAQPSKTGRGGAS